jgi:AraC family transcriptional regulator
MDRAIGSHGNPDAAANAASRSEAPGASPPTVGFRPAEIVRHRTGCWRGVHVETVQIISHERFEYSFKHDHHLLIAIEHGARYDGELLVEGLPTSTVRSCSHKLILVPAGRRFFGWQHPRQLTRSICLYIDPVTVAVDPDVRFDDADLDARMLFEDSSLWQTVAKLKAQIGCGDPSSRLYAEALGGVLAHELLHLHGALPSSTRSHRGGLAAWQQRRILEFMVAHPAENASLSTLAGLVRLSPYHFARSFKESFGEPPHRYWTMQRIERAKTLLADPRASVTQIALDLGFATTSAFSATFHRVVGRTPTTYRRALE